ncbi:hypothetical protein HELRODRAFT_158857 [Helobdella robusta]|uniref:Uncharacterized protein n=1 Tax=Helobdella robusta TaxID=6412 RepID=T1ENC5_HELRO|nr:hypothetical protein HELRODRAFT_158857 [Helobdella robusta]ESO12351.1 hypothetical protein HELRODRAFT_158857 [Helobdella robusta]
MEMEWENNSAQEMCRTAVWDMCTNCVSRVSEGIVGNVYAWWFDSLVESSQTPYKLFRLLTPSETSTQHQHCAVNNNAIKKTSILMLLKRYQIEHDTHITST